MRMLKLAISKTPCSRANTQQLLAMTRHTCSQRKATRSKHTISHTPSKPIRSSLMLNNHTHNLSLHTHNLSQRMRCLPMSRSQRCLKLPQSPS